MFFWFLLGPATMFLISLITKAFTFVSLIITLFLLGFLLIGNVSSAGAYSSVFMVKLRFNSTADALEFANNTVADRYITANYMGICAGLENGKKVCSAAANYTSLERYLSVDLQDTRVSLAEISLGFTEACHPRLLIVSLILVVLLLVTVLWSAIPLLPSKPLVRKISVGLCFLNVLIWGLGLMLQHQTVAAALKLVGPSSMGMVVATKGGRAEAMTWTAFAFMVVVLGMLMKLVIQNMKSEKKLEPEPQYPVQQDRYYYSDPKKYGYV